MTKTENLNLPQWVAEDPFQREDFNEAFASLDEGYSVAMSPYVVGTYTSSGSADTVVEVGFRPSVVVLAAQYLGTSWTAGTARLLFANGDIGANIVTINDTGFTIMATSTSYFPQVNNGASGFYMAFR